MKTFILTVSLIAANMLIVFYGECQKTLYVEQQKEMDDKISGRRRLQRIESEQAAPVIHYNTNGCFSWELPDHLEIVCDSEGEYGIRNREAGIVIVRIGKPMMSKHEALLYAKEILEMPSKNPKQWRACE